ncbi:hypothetical protein PYW07_010240 [Mythimna separata]|uniref:RRM domain-containing protein n=1 Tax=Mythimna separata TaxID=271217 RepID=A0AAD8DRI5_MYTSE|nr:hypothetical protein PYW07_010240 [Mythimna separata]
MLKPKVSAPSSRSTSSLSGSSSGYQSSSATSSKNENHRSPVDERKIVYVGRLEKDVTKQALGNKFAKFGRVVRVRIHSHDNGTLYGFVTYERSDADLDVLEAVFDVDL